MRKILTILTIGVFLGEIAFVVMHKWPSEDSSVAAIPETSLEPERSAEAPAVEDEAVFADDVSAPVSDESSETDVAEKPEPVEDRPVSVAAAAKKVAQPKPPVRAPRKAAKDTRVARVPEPKPADKGSALIAPEHYLMEAWRQVRLAQKKTTDEASHWQRAINTVDQMVEKHPQWVQAAEKQNRVAAASDDPFPYTSAKTKVTAADVQPLFQKYWALYHIGAAEFIRLMAYDHLQKIAQEQNDKRAWADLQWKKVDAAERILTKYSYAQAFDQGGWMWQPATSLREYVDAVDLPTSVVALKP